MKPKMVSFRVTSTEWASVQDYAAKRKLRVSECLRLAVRLVVSGSDREAALVAELEARERHERIDHAVRLALVACAQVQSLRLRAVDQRDFTAVVDAAYARSDLAEISTQLRLVVETLSLLTVSMDPESD